MFVKENTLFAIKEYFYTSLEDFYPKTEIDSFFYILTEHFLGLTKSSVLLNIQDSMSESELLKFHYAIKELKKYKPIQYITGSQFFYNHEFKVNVHTLIPRPETEELVDLIVKENANFKGSILDIGTGSGVIAISLDKAIPSAKVVAFDVSEEAIEIAKENNSKIKASVEFQIQDILNPTYFGQPFDIIVSNPPYVLKSEKELMKDNVLKYEPHLALFVEDDDPLLFYKRIIQYCNENLSSNGKLYFEINEKYGNQTIDLLKENDFIEIELIKDMQGKDRIVKGIKS